MSKRTFPYDAKRAKANARRQYLTASRVDAAKASTEGVQQLCEYLQSSAPKAEEDWSEIADLIKWFDAQLHRPRGPRKGSVRMDERKQAFLFMAFLVRDGKRGYGKPMPKKKLLSPRDNVEDQLINRAIHLVEREWPKMQDKIEVYELRKFKKRLPPWVITHVCEFMPDAREEMRSLGKRLRERQLR